MITPRLPAVGNSETVSVWVINRVICVTEWFSPTFRVFEEKEKM